MTDSSPPKATEDTLGSLHALVATELIAGLKSDDPDLRFKSITLAIKFLKDNNISCDMQSVNGESLIDKFEAIAERLRESQPEEGPERYTYDPSNT